MISFRFMGEGDGQPRAVFVNRDFAIFSRSVDMVH
jgi:hypothetical protein